MVEASLLLYFALSPSVPPKGSVTKLYAKYASCASLKSTVSLSAKPSLIISNSASPVDENAQHVPYGF